MTSANDARIQWEKIQDNTGITTATLLLPLVYLSQERFQHGLHRFAWVSFNGRDQLCVTRVLVIFKYTLRFLFTE